MKLCCQGCGAYVTALRFGYCWMCDAPSAILIARKARKPWTWHLWLAWRNLWVGNLTYAWWDVQEVRRRLYARGRTAVTRLTGSTASQD